MELEFPDTPYQAIRGLVRRGWFASEGELVREAARRYFESHSEDLMEQLVRDDIEWGLRGRD
jgi:Arc/MetJ-type ribon-helix-helix transcriptional regulator